MSGREGGPAQTIVCVDCGGTCHLITYPRADERWEPGDIATYRCSDCGDRWDLVVELDDLEDDDEGV
jgi:hypothetical protein